MPLCYRLNDEPATIVLKAEMPPALDGKERFGGAAAPPCAPGTQPPFSYGRGLGKQMAAAVLQLVRDGDGRHGMAGTGRG
jgi:hypothetical protein